MAAPPNSPLTCRITRATKLATCLTVLLLLTTTLSFVKPSKFAITASHTLSFHHALFELETTRLFIPDGKASDKSIPIEVAPDDPRAPALVTRPTIVLSTWRPWSTASATIGHNVPASPSGNILFISQTNEIRAVSVLLPLATLSLLIVFLFRRDIVACHRSCAGLCPNCHYDLRASPTQCPECGHGSEYGHAATSPSL